MSKYTLGALIQANCEILQGIATDAGLWKDYLDVMAQHTSRGDRRLANGKYETIDNQSALNCAAIQASSYQDTRELMSERDWQRLYPEARIKDDAVGIPAVKRSSSGKYYYVAELYPAEVVANLPEDRYRNLTAKINLDDDIDAQCFDVAIKGDLHVFRTKTDEEGKSIYDEDGEKVREPKNVSFDEIDPNTAYVVCSHFGIAPDENSKPTPPGPEVVDDLGALKSYCDSIRSDATSLCNQIRRSFVQTRDEMLGIERDKPQKPAQRETEAKDAPAVSRTEKMQSDDFTEKRGEAYVPTDKAPSEVASAARASVVQPLEEIKPVSSTIRP